MFGAFSRSFKLVKESAGVLRQDPELILLTLGSFAGVLLIVLVAGVVGLTSGAIDPEAETISGFGAVLVGLSYFLGYFIIIYFEVALVSAIQFRMAGGDPDVWYGISRANRRLPAILGWALIAATVSVLLRMLEQAARRRGGIIGAILVRVLSFGWSLMVFFVIPVVAAEGVGPIEAIKRSGSTIKGRWGEAIIGTQGIGFIMMIATVIVAGIPFAIGYAAVGASPVLGMLFFGIAGATAVFMWALAGSLESTYRAVLYAYASDGQTHGFSKEALDGAFAPKQDIRRAGF
jgi:hypothetical protein